jgi:integrase
LLLEEGAGLATISERMGHSSVRTTADIYSHAIRGKDEWVAKMCDKIEQPACEASKSKVMN